MKITKIITAINENNTYTEFIPLLSLAWQKLTNLKPTIGFISLRDEHDDFVQGLKQYGDIRLYRPVPDVDSGVQAKITRMCMAANDEFLEENCMLVDADMIPLSRDVVDVFEKIPPDHLVKWGYDHPTFMFGTPNYGKWPMDRTTAPGYIFKEIVNPCGLQYEDLIKSWFGFYRYGKEDVTLPFNSFSDESLLRALYENWKRKNTNTYNLSRLTLEENMLSRRLDRSNPRHWDNLADKLRNNEFIEVHGIRPFKKNIHYYEAILEFFEIKKEHIL